jgi:hypothetical protein
MSNGCVANLNEFNPFKVQKLLNYYLIGSNYCHYTWIVSFFLRERIINQEINLKFIVINLVNFCNKGSIFIVIMRMSETARRFKLPLTSLPLREYFGICWFYRR